MIFDGWRKAKEKSFRKGGDPYIENIFFEGILDDNIDFNEKYITN